MDDISYYLIFPNKKRNEFYNMLIMYAPGRSTYFQCELSSTRRVHMTNLIIEFLKNKTGTSFPLSTVIVPLYPVLDEFIVHTVKPLLRIICYSCYFCNKICHKILTVSISVFYYLLL